MKRKSFWITLAASISTLFCLSIVTLSVTNIIRKDNSKIIINGTPDEDDEKEKDSNKKINNKDKIIELLKNKNINEDKLLRVRLKKLSSYWIYAKMTDYGIKTSNEQILFNEELVDEHIEDLVLKIFKDNNIDTSKLVILYKYNLINNNILNIDIRWVNENEFRIKEIDDEDKDKEKYEPIIYYDQMQIDISENRILPRTLNSHYVPLM